MVLERNTHLLVVGFTSPVTTAKCLKHAKDIDELCSHLLYNGYKSKYSKYLGALIVPTEEYYEVLTILQDRRMNYLDNITVNCEYDLTNYYVDANGNSISEDNFVVPESWLHYYWDNHRNEFSTKAETFEKFLESYDPRTDGQELFQSALEANILVTAGGICL